METNNIENRPRNETNMRTIHGLLCKISTIPHKAITKQQKQHLATSALQFSALTRLGGNRVIVNKNMSTSCSNPVPANGETTTSGAAGGFSVIQFPCRDDNYGYLFHDETTGATAAIDTPYSPSYERELQSRDWTLTDILNTHHHFDHVGGNMSLKKRASTANGATTTTVQITGPQQEARNIPGIDRSVQHG